MSTVRDLTASKRLMDWIGDNEDDFLIAYSDDLRDCLTALMATQNNLQGCVAKEDQEAIGRAASLMARISIDMKTIHRELYG